jgi:hypothetical protein
VVDAAEVVSEVDVTDPEDEPHVVAAAPAAEFLKPEFLLSEAGLPDGLFSNKKSQCGSMSEGLR